MRTCKNCGKSIEYKHKNAVFCGPKCKDVYPFTDVCVSGQVYCHQYPLNAKWDWGWVVSVPFIPTVAYHRCRLRNAAEETIWEAEQGEN